MDLYIRAALPVWILDVVERLAYSRAPESNAEWGFICLAGLTKPNKQVNEAIPSPLGWGMGEELITPSWEKVWFTETLMNENPIMWRTMAYAP